MFNFGGCVRISMITLFSDVLKQILKKKIERHPEINPEFKKQFCDMSMLG